MAPPLPDLGVEVRSLAPRFPNYAVATDGRIFSCVYGAWRERVCTTVHGYRVVLLCADGKKTTIGVHRLIAFAWHGEWSTRERVVRHLDNNKQNNHPTNLAFGTPMDNARDSMRDGVNARGERVNTCNLTESQVIAIRQAAASGERQKDIAARMGVHVVTVNHIVVGRTWRHLTPELQTHKGRGKLTSEQRRQVIEMRAAGAFTTEIAARFGVDQSSIVRIVNPTTRRVRLPDGGRVSVREAIARGLHPPVDAPARPSRPIVKRCRLCGDTTHNRLACPQREAA